MEKQAIEEKVRQEMEYITRDPANPAQFELRMIYNAYRRTELAADAGVSAGETLKRALVWAKRNHPAGNFQYDQEFFGL